MSSSPSAALLFVAVTASTVLIAPARADEPRRYGIGRAPTAAEIAAWDIDVRPDGHGVKRGRGTVAQGQPIYDAQCASCHGTFGESNRYMAIAGGVRPGDLAAGRASELGKPEGVRTLGTKLNSAATLWDYINRAMPWTNPQSLSVDEVYAVTAYVLHLNEIVPADFVLTDQNLLGIRMPNRNGMTLQHGLTRVDGKPDAQGSNCMKNCIPEVVIVSSLPEYARNQHGNLAEQARALGPTRGIDTSGYGSDRLAAAPASAPKPGGNARTLIANNACTACHGVDSKLVGPAFREVGAKYQNHDDAEGYLTRKIRQGGQGSWGTVPMPPSALSEADARAIAQWILGGAR